MNNHNEFILAPVSKILNDVVSASASIGDGIETFPLCDYVMQSVFLKMTGAQEQKMKIICWEIATNDHEYRYEFTKTPLGECSRYEDKKDIYKDLVKQIKKHGSGFNIASDLNKRQILSDTTSQIKNIFLGTNLVAWTHKNFNEFDRIWRSISYTHFANDDSNLFTGISNGVNLKWVYDEYLYKRRNRIAHNTQSYQQNLPTLKTLMDDNYIFENYFIYFSILVLIDKIFIELYSKYLLALKHA